MNTHFPTNGNWEGLSLGWTTVVWLAFLLSGGDHRLYRVEPWVKAHRRTLYRCIGHQVKPRDLTDDRLAAILDYLSVADHWAAFERALNQSVLRVYDLQGRMVRVDTTTAAAYVTPAGLFQLGHSKDHRPDLPQVKITMAVLDPLGLPLTMTVVAGHTADDPLYLPEIAKSARSPGPPNGRPMSATARWRPSARARRSWRTKTTACAHSPPSECQTRNSTAGSTSQRVEAKRDPLCC